MTLDQHLQAFIAYVGDMLAEAKRYLTTESPDPLEDSFGYRMAALWLTDAEYTAFLRDLSAVFKPRLANAPAKNRHLRPIYTYTLYLYGLRASREVAWRTSCLCRILFVGIRHSNRQKHQVEETESTEFLFHEG